MRQTDRERKKDGQRHTQIDRQREAVKSCKKRSDPLQASTRMRALGKDPSILPPFLKFDTIALKTVSCSSVLICDEREAEPR